MPKEIPFEITPQPNDVVCGPSCLHAVYRFHGDSIPVEQVIREVPQIETGGTLAAFLGIHALKRGYAATIYTADLQLFDPSWFEPGAPPMRERMIAQMKAKPDRKLRMATQAYLEFVDNGGELRMQDIKLELFAALLDQGTPIITALCETWLYRCKRERVSDGVLDDAAGLPSGHFVIVHGIDTVNRRAKVADPHVQQPFPTTHFYEVDIDRLIGAVMLGIMTYDAKLLIVRPKNGMGK